MKLEDPEVSFEGSLESNFGKKSGSRWKAQLFGMMYNYIPRTPLNDIYVYFLLVWSFLQLSAISIVANDAPDPVLSNVVYFRIFPLVEYPQSGYLYFTGMVMVSVGLLVYGVFIVLSLIFRKGWGMSFVSTLLPALYWIGVIPITELFVSFFHCQAGKHYIATNLSCSSALYYVFMVFVVIMLVFWGCILAVITFVSTYSHPYSGNQLAHFPWNFEVLYTAIRVLYVAVDFLLDFNEDVYEYSQWILSFVVSVYFLTNLIGIFPYYNSIVSWLYGCSAMAFFLTLLSSFFLRVTEGIFDYNTSSRVIFYLCSIIVCIPVSYIVRKAMLRGLIANSKLNSPQKLDMQVYCFLSEFVTRRMPTRVSGVFMEGYLHYFEKTCKDKNCPLFSPEQLDVSRVFYDDSCEEGKRLEDKNARLRHLAVYLLESRMSKERTTVELSMQLARMYAYVLGNIHQACVKVTETEELDPGITTQFALFCFKKDIMKYLRHKIISQHKKGRGSFYNVLVHERLFNEFVEALGAVTKVKIKFWTELINTSNLSTLHKLGFQVVSMSMRISAIWSQLSDIYPYHRPSLVLYLNYLYTVEGYYDEAASIEQLLNKSQWQQRDAKELTDPIIFSEKSATIMMGGENYNSGKILSATTTTEQLLGYAPKTLVNKDVAILMPLVFRKQHKEIVRQYFRTGKKTAGHGLISNFALHKDGYVLPIKIAKQQIYSLRLGIAYVANILLDSGEQGNDFILTDTEGKISGISERLSQILRVTPSMLVEQQLFVQDLCPELGDNYAETEGAKNITFSLGNKVVDAFAVRKSSMRPGELKKLVRDGSKGSLALQAIKKCQIVNYYYPQIDYTFKVVKVPPVKVGKPSMLGGGKVKKGALSLEIVPAIKRMIKHTLTRIFAKRKEESAKKCEEEKAPSIKVSEEAYNLNNTENSELLTTDLNKNNTTEKFLGTETRGMHTEHVPEIEEKSKKPLKLTNDYKSKNDAPFMNLNLNTPSLSASSRVSKSHLKLSGIRNQPYSHFNPAQTRRLRCIIYFFTLLLFCGVLARFVTTLIFNRHFRKFGDLIMRNSRRFTTAGNVAKMATVLVHYNPGSLLDVDKRDAYFDYAALLKRSEVANTYKSYMMQQVKESLASIHDDENAIADHIAGFDSSHIESINPNSIAMFYKALDGSTVLYHATMEELMLSILDYTLVILQKVEEGTVIDRDNFEEFTVLNSTYGNLLSIIESSHEGITAEYSEVKDYHASISVGLIVGFSVILVFLIAVLFFFIMIINNELSLMLSLLLQVKRGRITKQMMNNMKFLKNVLNKESETNEEEILKLEETDASALEDAKDTEAIKRKKTRSRSVKKLVPHKSVSLKIIAFSVFLSGLILLAYTLYEYVARRMCSAVVKKSNELQVLVANLHFHSYVVAFLYSYISLNKKAVCGAATCEQAFGSKIARMDSELNSFLILHKENENLMSKRYADTFRQVVEENPCTVVERFRTRDKCTTWMGGVFTGGAYAGSKSFIELATALFMDFNKRGDEENKVEYLDDERLLDIEILANYLLNPAYLFLADELIYDQNQMIDQNNKQGIIVFAIFGAFVLIITIVGKMWLVQYLRRSMYETKIMLCTLPPEMILSNDRIAVYLSRESPSAKR